MPRPILLAAAAAIVAAATAAHAAGVTEVWRTAGLDLPESVTWDDASKTFYVSNIGCMDPTAKDGNETLLELIAR